MFCLLFLFVVSASANHVQWAIENGAFLHEALVYRDNGMYAIDSVEKGDVLAKIPKSMEFACKNCSLLETVEAVKSERAKPNSFWTPYFDSLPTECQSGMCKEQNASMFTLLGMQDLKRQQISPEASVVASRRWTHGMMPLLDLFNHQADAYTPLLEGNEYVLRASVSYRSGDEVHDKYSNDGIYKKYLVYGFIEDKTPNCVDMRTMRIGPEVNRVACIAYANSTVSDMVLEMVEALKHNDIAMLKGGAQWIDRHTNFNF